MAQKNEQQQDDFEYAVELPDEVAAALRRKFDQTQKAGQARNDVQAQQFDKTQKGAK